MVDEGVEYLEASLLVDRPPENMPPKTSGEISRPVFPSDRNIGANLLHG
jgi:hypothetical protein